ncbi:MAG: hypothetical protein O3B90_04215 [Actinomycetota bacterium]|jgi:hypothetical protein|nr:hypothetical protein [Actinomycetota bacterium]
MKRLLGITVDDIPGGAQVTQEFLFEHVGANRPLYVAELIFCSYV